MIEHRPLRAQARTGRGAVPSCLPQPVRIWNRPRVTMIVRSSHPTIFLEVDYVQVEHVHVTMHAILAERGPPVMTMPRTVEEILAHADELASTFENDEPQPDDDLDPHVVALLRAAVAARSTGERHILEAVRAARTAGLSWSAIGTFLGTSGEAARQRYASKVLSFVRPRDDRG